MKAFTRRALVAFALVFASSLLAAEKTETASEPNSATVGIQPVPLYEAPPVYPPAMWKKGISGQVIVDFIVDKSGKVVNPYALRSTRKEFEAAAVEAVSKWRFKPGTIDGVPVNTHMQVPIVFQIQQPAKR